MAGPLAFLALVEVCSSRAGSGKFTRDAGCFRVGGVAVSGRFHVGSLHDGEVTPLGATGNHGDRAGAGYVTMKLTPVG